MIAYPHVAIVDGVAMVDTVPVHRIFSWHRSGTKVSTLVERYPALGIARILAALAFAYDNQAIIIAASAREAAKVLRGE